MEIRCAAPADLEILWDRNITENPDDERWVRWKREFIGYNRSGKARTFCVVLNGCPVGEGTLLLSSDCKAVAGRKELCNDRDIANINALRIQKAYEGKGYIAKLMKEIERYAVCNGISKLTIGVAANETRNLAIYLHWGFTEFLSYEIQDGQLVLYFEKNLHHNGLV